MNLLKRNKYINKVIAFAVWGLSATSLFSCVDDKLGVEDPTVQGEENEDCIAFMMQIDSDGSTRAGNFSISGGTSEIAKYDDYIDTQDKLRIFFFTDEGDFLFGATDRVVGRLENTGSTGYWYVRIPMTMIVDRENQEYDINKIKNYLKQNPFKIAVLANWPNAGAKVNPADWDDSEGTQNSGENPSSTLKGNPLWNWSNSILNVDAKPEDIRNINDLHHVYQDPYYGDPSRKDVFSAFMSEDGNMGEPTDWVKMREVEEGWTANYVMGDVTSFDSKASANQWIRANWTPDTAANQNKKIYRHYQHMWFLWNFDASYKYGEWLSKNENPSEDEKIAAGNKYYGSNWDWNDGNAAEVINGFGKEWYGRNGEKYLYPWIKRSLDNKEPLENLRIDIGETNNDVFFQYEKRDQYNAYAVKVGENYGIQLPAISGAPQTSNQGLLSFQARTTGTLRVKWSSFNGVSSTLAVQRALGSVATVYTHPGYSSDSPTDWTYDNLNYIDIAVEGNSVPIYIYSTQGNAVVYSIEFIRGRYLFETDREGVMPSAEQGIPMYGLQRYDPIGDWQRGTTFNLSEGENGKNISLIRALAKVEVFIKKDFGKPRHVIMRNINRAARCEPMDVESPTDSIWNDNHAVMNEETSKVDQLCEWFAIQRHGSSYKVEDYAQWLNWFYGSWKNASWKSANFPAYRYNNTNGYWMPNGGHTGWNKELPASDTEKAPRVFNPYIYRNDFCRFLLVDDKTDPDYANYYHFILYLPEKNISDPATAGVTGADPRVPHIEYRFYPQDVDPKTDEVIKGFWDKNDPAASADDRYSNSEYNLDDNDTYRIYFTNYGYSTNDQTDYLTKVNNALKNREFNQETYDQYERDNERLSFHWPIMRNHSYKLYVGGEGPQNPEIHVEVSDWSHKKVVVKW